jgi:23S rRNA (cytidine1920-2'-O)/16S rRNA (cytidine1409-2'-O)-methyltransferase
MADHKLSRYNNFMSKMRLDVLLVELSLAESRSQAQRLIMAGQVRVDGQVAFKPGFSVSSQAVIEVDRRPRFVSRGGDKLEAALAVFHPQIAGKVCADVGASTGGFTDCLLQHGAATVYAIDVGSGILEWKLRQDRRVVVMEGTNARFIDRLPEPVELVTVDASFISLKILLPVIKDWFGPQGGEAVTLIKPQFEAGRQTASRCKGVVRDPQVHRQVLENVLNFALDAGYSIRGLIRSPLLGPKGNVEFLAHLTYDSSSANHSQADNLERFLEVAG